MKRTNSIICLFTIFALCLALTVPAFATGIQGTQGRNYEFSTGEDTLAGFGRPTSSEAPVNPDPMGANTRRNNNAAVLPPPYGVFSGEIPTDPASFYHGNTQESVQGGSANSGPLPPALPGIDTTQTQIPPRTEPLYYPDGSIGTLYVVRTGRAIKVYEGEWLDNLRRGAGHFPATSAWDGNVAMCGHNRGQNAHFSFVMDMQVGDRVTYTTLYGTRTYEVYSRIRISENDRSKLGWSAENILTLITCVMNVPELRWAAQLREVV